MLSPPADNSLSSGQIAKSSFPKRREAGPLSQSQAGAAGGDHRLWGVLQGAHSQRHTRPGHLGPPWTPRTTRVQKRLSPGSQTGLAVKGPREQVLQEQNAHRQGRGGTLTAEASTVEETPLVSSRAWLQLLLPKRAALYSLRLTLQSSKQRNHDPGAIAGREGGKVRARVLAVCTRPSSKRKKDSGGYLNRVRGSDTGRPEFTGTRSPPLPVAGPQLLTAAWRGRSPPLTSIFFFKANHKTLLCVLF